MTLESNTLKQTIILGVFFLLLVTTYASFSNIITFIFEHDSQKFPFTGGLALILNYVIYMFGLTYAASLRNYKRQFQIAAITYTIGYALYIVDLNEEVRLIVSIIAALIGGYGASVLWVSQGGYMVKLFKKYNIKEQEKGQYMGILNGIIYGQVILGGTITAFALGLFGNFIYFIVLTVVGLLALLFVHFFLDSLEGQSNDQESNQNGKYQNHKDKNYIQIFFIELIKVFKFYPKMKLVIPAMVLDGFLLGFTTTNFSNLLKPGQESNFNVGLLHISNGLGAIIGGYLSGFLSTKISVLKQGVILFLYYVFSLLLTYLLKLVDFDGLYFPLFITFLWGITLFSLEGWLFVCCVKLFSGTIESFAVVKQIHTFSFIIFQVYSLLSGQTVNFYLTITILLGIAIFQLFICFLISNKRKNVELVEEEPLGQISPIE